MSIDLNPSPELGQMVATLRKMLADRFPASRLRGQTALDTRSEIAALAELGFLGIGVVEEAGGIGLGAIEEAQIHIEFGRQLASPDVLAATLGAAVAAASGGSDLAARILAGEIRLCLGSAHGEHALLLNADHAELAVIWSDVALHLVEMGSATKTELESGDATVSLSRINLSDAPIVAQSTGAESPILLRAHLLIAAQFLGMAEAIRDMAAAYATMRQQFDQPIGAFQAVKHRCANMAIATTALRAHLAMAALAVQSEHADAALQVDSCRLLATRYALESARSNIQVHGGIGFSAECDAHLYVLRLHLFENIGTSRGALLHRVLTHPSPAFLLLKSA